MLESRRHDLAVEKFVRAHGTCLTLSVVMERAGPKAVTLDGGAGFGFDGEFTREELAQALAALAVDYSRMIRGLSEMYGFNEPEFERLILREKAKLIAGGEGGSSPA